MLHSKVKKYKVNGFKFHQYALTGLREEIYNYEKLGRDKPLHPSAVAMYIGLVSECSPAGLIDADVSIQSIARKLNLSPSTAHKGFHQLRDRMMVTYTRVGEKEQIEIVGYDEANRSRVESAVKGSDLSYFNVPQEIFNTPVIAQLVSSTSSKGLILLLETCNHFSRDFKDAKKDINSNPDELTMQTLKKKLGLSCAARVRKVIDVMAPIFTFKPVDVEVRKPRKLIDRLRKAVDQLHVRKYMIYINPSCVIESSEDVEIDAVKALKDAVHRLKSLRLPVTKSNRNGMAIAYHSIVKGIAKFIGDAKVKKELLQDSMQSALENLEQYIKEHPVKVESVGAYINKQLQSYVLHFLDKLEPEVMVDLQTDIARAYNAVGNEPPYIWQKFVDFRNKKSAS